MSYFHTCRFCGKHAHDDWLVKYGTRHYAHPSCYLRADKHVSDLPEYEKRYFDSKLHDEVRLKESRGF